MKPLYVACVAAIVLAACDDETAPTAVSEPGDAAVKVGFLVSGDRITYPNGARIAVDEVNERGGVLGRSVELVIQMDLQAAAAAVQAAETMILTDEVVVALIGPNRSSHAIEVGAVAQSHGVPMVTTAATNPAVTAAAVLTQREEVYSEGIGEFFIDHFGGLGETIVADESYEGGATDFDAQLTRIAAATPGAMFLPGLPPEVTLLTTQARALPLQDAAGEPTLFLGADAWDNPTLLDNEEAAIDGSFFSSHFSPDTNEPSARAFVDMYQRLYGTVPPAVMRSATMRSGCSWKPQSERAVSTQTSCARNYWLPKDTPGQPTSPTITNIAIRPRARSL